jgi:hypothetical protein
MRRRWIGLILRVLAALLVIALGGLLIWLRPFAATEPALGAMRSGDGIVVEVSANLIAFRPPNPATVGVVFYPGARRSPRLCRLHAGFRRSRLRRIHRQATLQYRLPGGEWCRRRDRRPPRDRRVGGRRPLPRRCRRLTIRRDSCRFRQRVVALRVLSGERCHGTAGRDGRHLDLRLERWSLDAG